MALQHLRSATANKRPSPSSMSDGQLAVNTNSSSPGLFTKDSGNALLKIGPVHIGATAPNASPASGGHTGNSIGEQWLDTSGARAVLKAWNGSAWVEAAANALVTARQINGTNFDGTASITTASWGTGRTITVGNTGKTVDGSGNVSWSLTEIGVGDPSRFVTTENIAQSIAGVKTFTSTITGSISGNAGTATTLETARNINGTSFNGSGNITTASWGTSRSISIGGTTKSVDGSANVTWATSEITANTVTTNANLTGDVTSVGNATSIASGVIVNADISASAAIADTKLATISTAGKVSGAAITSDSINTSGQLNITNGAPTISLTESDGIATHSQTMIVRDGNTFQIQARNSAGSFIATDYSIAGSVSGATDHRWSVTGSERMRITSAGNVGIGTTSITERLTVDGNAQATSFLATSTAALLRSTVGTGFVGISGGTASNLGGNVACYGDSHATIPNEIRIRQGGANRILIGTAGSIALTSGGTNQNITLTPSGTGTVNALTFNATSTTAGGFQGIANDTVATPSFTWTGDLDTGVYRSNTNEVGIAGGGAVCARFGGSVLFFKNTFVFPVDDPAADATTTTRNSATLNWRGKYWNGTASVNTDWNTVYVPSDTAGNGQWRLRNGSTNRLTVDNSGTVTATTFAGALTGNASTATTLANARTINGTSFNGSGNITTTNWGTARTLTIGDTGKSVNGSGNVSWTLAEIGALGNSELQRITKNAHASGASDCHLELFSPDINVANEVSLRMHQASRFFGQIRLRSDGFHFTDGGNNNGRNIFARSVSSEDGSVASTALGFSLDADTGFYRPSTNTLGFVTNSSERMRVVSDGSVLIGKTTNDDSNAGFRVAAPGLISIVRDGNLALVINRLTSDGTIASFRRSGTQVGTIAVTTTNTAYNTSSDYRLKENVVDLDGAIDRLKQLPVHRFNFIVDPDTVVDGFIAHEAAEVVPECVTGNKDEIDDDGNPVYQGIDQSKIVPLLTAALQEAIAKIETLEQRLTAAGID